MLYIEKGNLGKGDDEMLDFIGLLFSLGLLVLCIYILSRVFHFFNDTKLMLAEIEKKLDEIQKVLNKKMTNF